MSRSLLYTHEGGQVVRMHPCGYRQAISLAMAEGLRDAHRRLCAGPAAEGAPTAGLADELDAAISAARTAQTSKEHHRA